MCGRFVRARIAESYSDFFGIPDIPRLFASFNVAPTQPVLAIRPEDGQKVWRMLRWGLIPSWAKDKKMSFINARGDSVFNKPAFRAAAKRRRCLIVADGYYEWKTEGKKKRPFYFRMKKDEPFTFAGIWERWEKEETPIESCSIVTTEANELSRNVHDRMPVILHRENSDAWIDPEVDDPQALAILLRPYPVAEMTCYEVGTAVNSVKNNGPQCIEASQ